MKNLLVFFALLFSQLAQSQTDDLHENVPYDASRMKKILLYHENNSVKIKGKEKRVNEWMGCIGYRNVYKKTGRWKYFNEYGDLLKIVKYKDDKEIKIIRVINK